jgi:hypothetical protein
LHILILLLVLGYSPESSHSVSLSDSINNNSAATNESAEAENSELLTPSLRESEESAKDEEMKVPIKRSRGRPRKQKRAQVGYYTLLILLCDFF